MSDYAFTCISCAVAFNDPALQRNHFGTDWHRYNMKRRISALPPISATQFNSKVLEKREENAVRVDPRGMWCECCRKQFSTESTFRSHISSKKHRVVEAKHEEAKRRAAKTASAADVSPPATNQGDGDEEADRAIAEQEQELEYQLEGEVEEVEEKVGGVEGGVEKVEKKVRIEEPTGESQASTSKAAAVGEEDDEPEPATDAAIPGAGADAEDEGEDDDDDDEGLTSLEAKLRASRSSLPPTHCLFCSHPSPSPQQNITHMRLKHSFFIPDAEYLVDVSGYLLYLGEKVGVGNVCLFCEGEFGSVAAVRQHMRDRGHAKVRYETEVDKSEFEEFYDFSKSYPDAEERAARVQAREERREERRLKREERRRRREELEGDGGWEEVDAEGEGEGADGAEEEEEVIVVDGEEEGSEDESGSESETESEFEDDNGITLAPDGLSLLLPSGRTLGHRSLKVYYSQNLRPTNPTSPNPSSSTALTTKLRAVRAKIADPTQALVPLSGGTGAFGRGQQVIKARNRGEARYVRKMAGMGLERRKHDQHATRVAMKVGNFQKHYRDPLLQ